MPTETRKMLINVDGDETRIAVVTGKTLDNLHIEQTYENRIIGNIYYGKVVKIQSSFQAAFIEYGADRHGFLAFSDVNLHLIKGASHFQGRPAIEKVLKNGQSLMVQVSRNEIGNKGASLTTNISLPGRFLVFMPNSDKGGVSKKIEDVETRARLKHLLEGLGGDKDSAIIRTAGVNRSPSELKRDFMVLRRKWNQILKKFEETSNPQLLYEEEDVVVRTLRDYFIDDIAEIWIDHPEAFQRSREFFKASIPGKQKRLQFYLGDRSLFSDYGIENQIEQLSSNHVPLPSGGSLVIDPTEALVAIDVNSGRYDQSNNIEKTALRTNVEAAAEVARQLRLRNLGGLIVIDFIDMISEDNRNTVIQTLEEYLQDDKAKWTLGSISQFGLLEMSRQRIANALSQETKTTCPTCGGIGEVLSVPSLANAVLRKIRDLAATGEVTEISSYIPVDLSNYLFNKKRQQLDELEIEFGINIFLTADQSEDSGKLPAFELKYKKGAKPVVEEEPGKQPGEGKNKSNKSHASRKRGKSSPVALETEETASAKEPEEEQKKPEISETPLEEEAPAVAEAPVASAEEREAGREPEPIEEARPIPLFSSVHQSPPSEHAEAPVKSVDTSREKMKDIPPGTVLFSSSHRVSEDSSIAEEKAPEPRGEVVVEVVKAAKSGKKEPQTSKKRMPKQTAANQTEATAASAEETSKKPARQRSPSSRTTKTKATPKTATAKTTAHAKTAKSVTKKPSQRTAKAKSKEPNPGERATEVPTKEELTKGAGQTSSQEKKEKTAPPRKRSTKAKSTTAKKKTGTARTSSSKKASD